MLLIHGYQELKQLLFHVQEIEKATAKEALGIELPVRTVNTFGATGVEMSFFVTNKGDIFVWPPFARSDDGLFYVNDTVTVKTPAGVVISGDDESKMYENNFEFVINDVTIKVAGGNSGTELVSATGLAADVADTTLEDMASVYYLDVRNAESPEGIESKLIYDDDITTGVSTVAGVDKD